MRRCAAVFLLTILSQGVASAEEPTWIIAVPEEILEELALDESKTQKVIYYVNETRPSDSLNPLVDWFRGADDARLRKLRELLKQDAKDFSEVMASEAEAIQTGETAAVNLDAALQAKYVADMKARKKLPPKKP